MSEFFTPISIFDKVFSETKAEYEADPIIKWKKKKWWLAEEAERQSKIVKGDCAELMKCLDENGYYYTYKPDIMLSDVDKCTGFIPDILIHIPYYYDGEIIGRLKVVIDFVDRSAEHYSEGRIKRKRYLLNCEGYNYYTADKGVLTERVIAPEVFLNEVAEKFCQ